MGVSKAFASVGANLVFARQARKHLNLRIFARGSIVNWNLIANKPNLYYNTGMKNLPIGIQTFSDFKERNYLYVDKTEQIHRLLALGGKYGAR